MTNFTTLLVKALSNHAQRPLDNLIGTKEITAPAEVTIATSSSSSLVTCSSQCRNNTRHLIMNLIRFQLVFLSLIHLGCQQAAPPCPLALSTCLLRVYHPLASTSNDLTNLESAWFKKVSRNYVQLSGIQIWQACLRMAVGILCKFVVRISFFNLISFLF